jgi:two-component system, chemotaxis family, CheB/CheR fusion protein
MSSEKARPPASHSPEYVVGIGASAGGLEALERFFDNVPKNTGMAFVVVQHLSPDFKSLMDELLARHTELPIRLVEDGLEIEPDHVYLIPPKKEMIISGGRLLLSERDHQQELSLPIDVFFRSLAQDCGPRAIAIVLSGGGSDGSRGIRDVHDAGGLVIVQNVESAQFDGMPKTARDAGVAHFVLAPHEMPRVLLEHSMKPAAPPSGDATGTALSPRATALNAVYRMLEQEFGIDFNHYKPTTVTRRIERRVQLALDGDINEYVDRLRRERSELDRLYRDLLIGVTRFFRNEEAFAALEHRVLPELFRRGTPEVPLRVWITGCATGEEAYSLAILLHEASTRHEDRPVKIFASDVHRGSLEFAARGIYEAEAIENVSQERLERYFIQRGQSYQVVPEIRQMIVFAPHNVIRDAPFTRIDLISCRNLLIYLQPAAQQKALSLFHFGLNRGGIMFLGPSESLGLLGHDFETVDKHWRIYRKYSDVRIPIEPRLQVPKVEAKLVPPALHSTSGRNSLAHLLGTYDTLLERFMPPSLLVSDRGELLQAFGGASRFLRHRDGRQSNEVLDAVDAELKTVLAGNLKRAQSETSALIFRNVRITAEGETHAYRVTLARVQSRGGTSPSVLVSFETMAPAPSASNASATEVDASDVPQAQIAALQGELNSTRESLQTAIEELETSNEEMQTTNEELHASNEELQSTNEELQSVNEELYSVNAEYQRKIMELTELTNDMENLLSSTDIGTIFLNRELKVRKVTPQIAQAFNLLPQDVGRPIEAFTQNIDHPELIEDLKRVLASGERVERELSDADGRCFFLRVLPYRAKGTIDGVVLTLIDVSSLKAAEDALFHERHLFNSLLSTVPDAIYFKDARGRFIRANRPVAKQFGLSDPRALVGKTPFELAEHGMAFAMHEEDEKVLLSGEAQHYRLEKRVDANERGGDEHWAVATRHPLLDRSQEPVGVITMLRDVTKQKRAEERIQEAVRRRDQFLAMLSHELRNPLGAVVTATTLMKASPLRDPELSKYIQIIDRQSQQMARLLDDLLEASRVTQNKIELRKRVLDLTPVVKEAADAVRSTMEARGLSFTVEVDSAPLCVNGDPARLQQLQMNLLNNAAKYTPRGGHVSLTAKGDGDAAVIRVRDDGTGIPREMLDSVFDLFVQSRRTLDRADGGLGVGLTLVRSLVTMHGGSVTAHSDGEGKGSEFVVRLPVVARPRDEAPNSRSRPKVSKGARVVVVEDNADSREMLCQLLALVGCESHAADTGLRGLELMDEVRPDLAIIDVGLPGMDGLELAQQVRANPKHEHVYLVALTGYGQASDRARALRAGFDEHVVKPIGPDTLVRLLSSGAEQHNEPDPDGSLVSSHDSS